MVLLGTLNLNHEIANLCACSALLLLPVVVCLWCRSLAMLLPYLVASGQVGLLLVLGLPGVHMIGFSQNASMKIGHDCTLLPSDAIIPRLLPSQLSYNS